MQIKTNTATFLKLKSLFLALTKVSKSVQIIRLKPAGSVVQSIAANRFTHERSLVILKCDHLSAIEVILL